MIAEVDWLYSVIEAMRLALLDVGWCDECAGEGWVNPRWMDDRKEISGDPCGVCDATGLVKVVRDALALAKQRPFVEGGI